MVPSVSTALFPFRDIFDPISIDVEAMNGQMIFE